MYEIQGHIGYEIRELQRARREALFFNRMDDVWAIDEDIRQAEDPHRGDTWSIVNGFLYKKDKKELFKAAWKVSKEAARRFGGSSKAYFSIALKEAYRYAI